MYIYKVYTVLPIYLEIIQYYNWIYIVYNIEVKFHQESHLDRFMG